MGHCRTISMAMVLTTRGWWASSTRSSSLPGKDHQGSCGATGWTTSIGAYCRAWCGFDGNSGIVHWKQHIGIEYHHIGPLSMVPAKITSRLPIFLGHLARAYTRLHLIATLHFISKPLWRKHPPLLAENNLEQTIISLNRTLARPWSKSRPRPWAWPGEAQWKAGGWGRRGGSWDKWTRSGDQSSKSRKNEKKQQKEKTEKGRRQPEDGWDCQARQGQDFLAGVCPRPMPKARAQSQGQGTCCERPAQKSAARLPNRPRSLSSLTSPRTSGRASTTSSPKGFQTWGGRWIQRMSRQQLGKKMQAIKSVFEKCIADKVKRQSSLQPPFYKFCAAAFRQHALTATKPRWISCRCGWASSVIISERHCSAACLFSIGWAGWAGFFERKKGPLQYTFPCKKKGWWQECWRNSDPKLPKHDWFFPYKS